MNLSSSFESSLADMLERFVVYKQMQGFDYTAQTNRLKYFDRFLCSVDCSDGVLHSEYFTGYLETLSHLKLENRKDRLGVVHPFSRYLNAYRPQSQVMPLRLLPVVTRSTRFCRITSVEVGTLMDAAESE